MNKTFNTSNSTYEYEVLENKTVINIVNKSVMFYTKNVIRDDIEKIQEIYDERQDPHAARFPIGLVCDARPTSYTVIPSLKDVGWLDKIEKQLDPNLK